MNYLSDLDLRGNPVQKAPKYRDQMVMLGLKLRKNINVNSFRKPRWQENNGLRKTLSLQLSIIKGNQGRKVKYDDDEKVEFNLQIRWWFSKQKCKL